MPIAGIYNIPIGDIQTSEWATVHAQHHLAIVETFQRDFNIQLPFYILDPFYPNDPVYLENWLNQHQSMHNQMNELLGLTGFNLAEVEWSDEGQLSGWIQYNATEHLNVGNILGVA